MQFNRRIFIRQSIASATGIATTAMFPGDVVNRTETAMTKDHCFLATKLALSAQRIATCTHPPDKSIFYILINLILN